MNESELQERIIDFLSQFNSTEQVLTYTVEECIKTFGENYEEIMTREPALQDVSCLLHAPDLSSSALVKGFCLIVLAVFSFIGNVATIFNIIKAKRRRVGHIYNLLFHLAVADLSVTLWCILGDAIWYLTVEWKLGTFECKIFKYAQMLSLYLSTYIMVIIGVDRFIAIKYPMKCFTKRTSCRLIILCWILSLTLSFPQVVVFKVMTGPFQEPFHQCVTYGSYSHDWQEQLYATSTIAFMFAIPLTIIATTYLLTVCTLHRNEEFISHAHEFRGRTDPNRRKLIRRAKMKSLRISFAIVSAFIICWSPYYASMIYTFINRKDDHQIENPDSILFTMCFFFGVSESFCNPVIFFLFHFPRAKNSRIDRGASRKTLFMQLRSSQIPKNGVENSSVNGIGRSNSNLAYGGMKSTLTVSTQHLKDCSLSTYEESTAV